MIRAKERAASQRPPRERTHHDQARIGTRGRPAHSSTRENFRSESGSERGQRFSVPFSLTLRANLDCGSRATLERTGVTYEAVYDLESYSRIPETESD